MLGILDKLGLGAAGIVGLGALGVGGEGVGIIGGMPGIGGSVTGGDI